MVSHTPLIRTRSRGSSALGTRVLFTLLGGAAFIVAAFLDWTRSVSGTDLTWHAVYQQSFFTVSNIVHSIGGVSIVVGLLALLGLAERSGWLTRLAGAVGVIAFALFAIQVERSSDHGIQVGAWVMLGAAVVSVLAGLSSGVRRETTLIEE